MLTKKIKTKNFHLLISIFVCCMLAQIPFISLDSGSENRSHIATSGMLSENNQILIQNAAVPLLLSEDNQVATQQLANLIQQTNIYRIQVYDIEKNLIGEALNVSDNVQVNELINQTLDIRFKDELAGTALLELQPTLLGSNLHLDVLAAFIKSIIITSIAFLLLLVITFKPHLLSLRSGSSKKEDTVLEPVEQTGNSQSAGSLLLYIYLQPENSLRENPGALSLALLSFGQKLEDHIHIYGGRVLSLSNDRIICRMPASSNRISALNYQQAITFCWGIARPLTFSYEDQDYRLNVTSVLHKTTTPARTGTLTRALNDLDSAIESKTIENGQGAYLTNHFLSEQDFSDFDHQASTFHPDLQKITRVKKSLNELWKKQEEMIKRDKI